MNVSKMRANEKDASRSITKRPPTMSSKKNGTSQKDGGVPKPRPASAYGRVTGLQNKKVHSSSNSLMEATTAHKSIAGAVSPRYLMNARQFGNNEPKISAAPIPSACVVSPRHLVNGQRFGNVESSPKSSAGAVSPRYGRRFGNEESKLTVVAAPKSLVGSPRYLVKGRQFGNDEPKLTVVAAPKSSAGSPRYLVKGRRFGNDESKLCSPNSSPESATTDAQAKITNASTVNKQLSLKGNDPSPTFDSAYEKDSFASNIPASPSIASDTCSEIMDMEKSGYWSSLLNLDGEDSQWISDIESEQDPFHSGFTSPPHRSTSSFDFQSCSSASSIEIKNIKSPYSFSSEDISESTEWEEFSNDDPVFWPLQQRYNSNSEKAEDSLCLSPGKEARHTHAEKDSPKCIEPTLYGTNIDTKALVSYGKMLAYGSGKLASKILEWERKIATNMISAVDTKPSRLSKSTDDPGKMDSIEMENNVIEPINQNDIMHNLVDADRKLLEEILKSSKMNLIETLVGLSEFNGHEGID